jgi:hypothetical protein
MGTCKHCGQQAGFFRFAHNECHRRYENGKTKILDLIEQSLTSSSRIDSLPEQIKKVAADSFIGAQEQHDLAVIGWEKAVYNAIEDDVLSETAERRLIELKNCMSLSETELNKNGAYTRATQSGIVRNLLNDVIPERVQIGGNLSVNLQKGEKVVWIFNDTKFFQDRTYRHYEGGSHGMSVRVAKGFYLRSSSFRGYPIDTTERVLVDSGSLIVTNSNVYFSGTEKAFRIPYYKILSFHPFKNGIEVLRNSATAKPLFFLLHDAHFAYNVLTNLARISSD